MVSGSAVAQNTSSGAEANAVYGSLPYLPAYGSKGKKSDRELIKGIFWLAAVEAIAVYGVFN